MSNLINEVDLSAWKAEQFVIYATRSISRPGSPLLDILRFEANLAGGYRVVFRGEWKYHGHDQEAAIESFNDISRGGAA